MVACASNTESHTSSSLLHASATRSKASLFQIAAVRASTQYVRALMSRTCDAFSWQSTSKFSVLLMERREKCMDDTQELWRDGRLDMIRTASLSNEGPSVTA